MEAFTKSIVADNRWDCSNEVDVKLSWGCGQAMHLKVHGFIPASGERLLSFQKRASSVILDIKDSLPIGIYLATPETMVESFDEYLDKIIDYHLEEYLSILSPLQKRDRSSRSLQVLFGWFQVCKEGVSSNS
jgi:hypothetical protein